MEIKSTLKKCIIVPDSFKGTMSSSEVCRIVNDTILNKVPYIKMIKLPVADGGEGTLEAFLSVKNGNSVYCNVAGPFLERMKAKYGRFGDTAVIEVAAIVGLPLVEGCENPEKTTTYGVGQMVLHAVKNGCKRIILGLGGSCTNDGAAGMATALGTKFINAEGKNFIPTGGSLNEIVRIDNSETVKLLRGIEIVAICDIENPPIGENGATHIYAKQKGADIKMIAQLEKNMVHFINCIKKYQGIDVSALQGGGAAGAMGAGICAFLNARLRKGIDVILDLFEFDAQIKDCDLVITGEGKLDLQSFSGKVIKGVNERAKKFKVPVVIITGKNDVETSILKQNGILAVYETSIHRKNMEEIKKYCKRDLVEATERMINDIFVKQNT